MKRIWMAAAAVAVCASVEASAQYPEFGARGQRAYVRPDRRPAVSPYLFLAGQSPSAAAFNYYEFIRPQQEFRRTEALQGQRLDYLRNEQLQQGRDLLATERMVVDQAALQADVFNRGLSTTGHPTSFLTGSGQFGVR